MDRQLRNFKLLLLAAFLAFVIVTIMLAKRENKNKYNEAVNTVLKENGSNHIVIRVVEDTVVITKKRIVVTKE